MYVQPVLKYVKVKLLANSTIKQTQKLHYSRMIQCRQAHLFNIVNHGMVCSDFTLDFPNGLMVIGQYPTTMT